jgi:hypothetical protein
MKSRTMILGLTIVAGLMAATPVAVAQTMDWRRLGQDGPFEIAVDVGSFAGPRTQRVARTAMVSLEESPVPYMVLNVQVDCEARTISALSAVAYNSEGSVLREGALEPDTAAIEESEATVTLAGAICDGMEIEGPAFESVATFAAWAETRSIEP